MTDKRPGTRQVNIASFPTKCGQSIRNVCTAHPAKSQLRHIFLPIFLRKSKWETNKIFVTLYSCCHSPVYQSSSFISHRLEISHFHCPESPDAFIKHDKCLQNTKSPHSISMGYIIIVILTINLKISVLQTQIPIAPSRAEKPQKENWILN